MSSSPKDPARDSAPDAAAQHAAAQHAAPEPGDTLDAIRATAVQIARAAGETLLAGFREPLDVRHKGIIDLVTDFDLRSEAVIVEALRREFPAHRVVAEEGGGSERGAQEDDLVWYVDPLDGTTNFAHGHPFFAVSMGLYRGAEGLVGVVVAPALGVCWEARRGGGALRNGVPCRVAEAERLEDTIVATGFPYDVRDNPDDNTAEFRAFLRHTRGVRRCGSAALDLAMVADGTYGLYWEQRLKAWDMAAGALLVLEAGGRLSDYGGGLADPRTGRLVASNGPLHSEALAVLAAARTP